jgi:hypothetical protein
MRSILHLGSWAALLVAVAAVSVSAEDLRTVSGKTYVGYTVLKVLPDALQVSHESGVSKVPLTDLPPEIRAQYAEPAAKAAEAAAKANAVAEAQRAKAPDPAVAEQAVAERRERQAEAVAARKERFQQLSAEAKPYFADDRTTFMKEGGGFLYAARGALIPVAGEAILVNGTVCTRARPELVPAEVYRTKAASQIEAMEKEVDAIIPEQIAKNEERIVDLEASIAALRAAADLADKNPPFEVARQGQEIRKLQKENKKLEKDKVAKVKQIVQAKAEVAKIDKALEAFSRQQDGAAR